MTKLSSYQKLKLKIKELEKENYKLKEMIFMDDAPAMKMVKDLFRINKDLMEAWWWGDSGKMKSGEGILSQMQKSHKHKL